MAKSQTVSLSTEVPPIPARNPWMHKGDAGRVLVVAGSSGMVGAAALCSRACLRAGAGLVRVGMPWRLAALVAGRDPDVMTLALPETDDGAISAMSPPKIIDALEGVNVLAIGPGLGTNPQTSQAVRNLLPEVTCQLVIDADALNAIAKNPEETFSKFKKAPQRPVITPHPGELMRLLGSKHEGKDLGRDEEARKIAARNYAASNHLVCVLKGHRTVVSDGLRTYVNNTGNPGMAKAGMGDVLTGVIAAFCAQGYPSFEAAVLGVYIHGLAGDRVRDTLGEIGMMASDVVEQLPLAARAHQLGKK
ncbi:MAG: NAD(P)H-hydrate dehydratase [Planctomycetes bacterium]|nr:NAD(P)H-hydrate dehydratase [Planctomycetota bacterium]